jgi:hypothetical protein
MNALDHFLLTSFNLKSTGAESLIRAWECWLRGRVDLFETYCLPSVRAQTSQSFRWIIYFDPDSPDWLMTWISSHASEGLFSPVFRATVPHGELIADLSSLIGSSGTRLLTTNLDNDDALAVDFVERVQAVAAGDTRTAIYLANGLIKAPNGLFRRVDRQNAFCSVAEPWEAPVTCWSDWHNRLHLAMPVVTLSGDPGWLQVVHGSNVSNRVRGVRVSPKPYLRLFPQLLDDVPPVGAAELVVDRVVAGPARLARDGMRAVAKAVVLAVLGKDGLSRVAAALAGLRNRARPAVGLDPDSSATQGQKS